MTIKGNNQTEFPNEIAYQAEIGVIFKNRLSISSNGINWKNCHYALEDISRVRWGIEKNSINGIPIGIWYKIAFGNHQTESVIWLRRNKVYSNFVAKLWKAVCIRLVIDHIKSLKSGEEIEFGSHVHRVLLKNDGITLVKYKHKGGTELTHCLWHQIKAWSSNGSFYTGMLDDKNTYVRLSYLGTVNIHILEKIIQMALNKPGIKLLSEVLQ